MTQSTSERYRVVKLPDERFIVEDTRLIVWLGYITGIKGEAEFWCQEFNAGTRVNPYDLQPPTFEERRDG